MTNAPDANAQIPNCTNDLDFPRGPFHPGWHAARARKSRSRRNGRCATAAPATGIENYSVRLISGDALGAESAAGAGAGALTAPKPSSASTSPLPSNPAGTAPPGAPSVRTANLSANGSPSKSSSPRLRFFHGTLWHLHPRMTIPGWQSWHWRYA